MEKLDLKIPLPAPLDPPLKKGGNSTALNDLQIYAFAVCGLRSAVSSCIHATMQSCIFLCFYFFYFKFK
jgi:hypothetical protein